MMYHNDNTIKTLQDILILAARNYPDRGIGYVNPDESIVFQTYPELLDKALHLLSGLLSKGFSAGDKVILAPDHNTETIPLLWACFLGRFIPTILQPPVSFSEYNPPAEKMDRIFRILGNPKVILSDVRIQGFNSTVISREQIIGYNQILESDLAVTSGRSHETDLAFIQFSSGSTGDPKGIMLTHKNILTNIASIGLGLDFTINDRMVNWMPLYHDMGLVGYHLSPIFGCFSQYHIDPIDFIKRPFIWLDIIDKCKITITGCPNFGQALLLRHLKRNKTITWDLSSLKVITNGAEPISVRIMNEFIDYVKPHKFRPEAMMPVYGMAESTLAITFSELLHQPVVVPFRRKDLNFNLKAVRADHIDSSAQLIPSVGKALNNIQYRIVNDEDQPIKESNIGHIQIKGPCVTSGYYNNPEVTQKAFCGDWLRTGDQGFVFEGNLYITGRYKDIIFIHGKNFYAHDLEHVAQSVDDVSFGKAIIGGVFDEVKGHDKVLLFLVGSATQETIATFNKIRNLFLETLGISIDVFIPIRSNQIPKTSSGKIQRYKLISAYLKGEFDSVINEVRHLTGKST